MYLNQWCGNLPLRNGIIAILVCAALSGCKKHNDSDDRKPLARVYDKYLDHDEISGLLNENTSSDDSARIISEYIDGWIRHNLILKVAEDNVASSIPEIDKQTEDYKESLIQFAYERQWLAENLDTVVKDAALQEYYDNHKADFALKSDIYKLAYAIAPVTVKSSDSIQYWFSRGIEKYRVPLERYAAQNCSKFSFNTDVWLNADDLFQLLPYKMYGNGQFRTKGPVKYADSLSTYYVKVEDFYLAGNIAPFDYYKEGIKDIIINKRKLELLKNTYQRIYSDGLQRNNAEIYTNEE